MPTPEQMREAVAGYVQEIHRSYVDQARTFPVAVQGRMPLLTQGSLTVAAVAARNLHLLATTEPLGPPQGQEVLIEATLPGLSWQLRFFDPVIVPSLALIEEGEQPAFDEVRHALGVGSTVYHLIASPGSGLSGHHAAHVGTGLANTHSSAARDFETIRSRVRGREHLVDELAGAAWAGLPHAQALLATAIVPNNAAVAEVAAASRPDPEALRAAVLTAVGGRTQWTPDDTPSDATSSDATSPDGQS